MTAVNRGCFGAVSQAAQFSLCVPVVLFKLAIWARNSSPSHHPSVHIAEQPESTQPGLLWGETKRKPVLAKHRAISGEAVDVQSVRHWSTQTPSKCSTADAWALGTC